MGLDCFRMHADVVFEPWTTAGPLRSVQLCIFVFTLRAFSKIRLNPEKFVSMESRTRT